MVNIQLLCVGKLKEKHFSAACAEYQKRLGAFCKLTVTELPEVRLPEHPTPTQVEGALAREGEALLAKLPKSTKVIALCVEGRLRSSPELAQLVGTFEHSAAKHLVLLIGGSYGLAEQLKAEAWVRLSMSPMTFPHHLARVMVLEQLYRAFKIREGSSYHK